MREVWTKFFILLPVLIGASFLGAAPEAVAQVACSVRVQGLVIQAETCDRDTDADTLELEGNVQIIFKDQHLTCDRTKVNFRARSLDAQGNVLLTSPLATVGGSRVLLDYESNTGMIFDGYVQSGPVLFEGTTISKLGESEYLANEARFTACDNCPESWSFSGQRIRAELGGYAFIKSSFLRIGGVPVFWLPYLIVPLKSERQTGLLTPEFELSDSGGPTFGESYFWAISRSQDATLGFKNYTLRGLKTSINYRYALTENSYGDLNMAFMRDRIFGTDERLNAFRPATESGQPINRWFAKYEHYLELPEGFIQRMQINNASDLQYSKDFPLETLNHGDSSMENRVSLSRNSNGHHFSVDASYYVNLLQYDPISSNNDAVHRAPEVRYSKTLEKVGGSDWLYSLDIDSTHFNRSEFGYDDLNAAYNPTGPNDRHLEAAGSSPDCSTSAWYNNKDCVRARDGQYDPDRDILRTGHRLDMRGTLMKPYRFGGFFDVIPKLSYRETTYQFNVDRDSQNTRRYVRAELGTKALFSANFGDETVFEGTRYKHEVQPEVTLTTIPWFNQPAHPFFGSQTEVPLFSQETISDADINSPYGIQFDFNDRLFERKLATVGITNKIIQKRFRNHVAEYRQILFWRVAQSYDFYQMESNTAVRQPLSDIVSDLRVNLDQVEVYQRANYYPYQNVTNLSTRLRYNFLSGDFLQLAYVQNFRDIAPNQAVDVSKRTEDYTLSLRKTLPFADLLGRVTYDVNPGPGRESNRFKSYGYGAQFKLPGDCWYFNVTQYRTTGGENHFQFQFDFIWDGQKRAALPESLLDSLAF